MVGETHHPDKAGFVNRLFSLLLVLFLLTMPITALNGIVSIVCFNDDPANKTEILNYGGIIGHSIYVRIDLISEILFHWNLSKACHSFFRYISRSTSPLLDLRLFLN